MVLNDQTRLRTASECLTSQFDNDMFLLALKRSEYFRLNPVAARIWNLLAGEPTFGELCHKLMEDFDVDEQTCRNDVRRVLDAMLAVQLIEVEPRPRVPTPLNEP